MSSTVMRVFVAAVLEFGALLGALSAGALVDRLSRRGSISFACGTYLDFGELST